jgi:nucleotide-binding universal stress UspA family protein
MFQNIVFAYDGSVECQDALEEGIALARRFGARCQLVAAIPPWSAMALATGPLPEGVLEDQQSEAAAILENGLARLRQAGLEATGVMRVWEEPAQAIGAVARAAGADLVIVGHHQRSAISRWWRSSVGHSLMDHVSCSLLICMPRSVAGKADARQVGTS